jgi:hypothetical protein
MDKFQKKKIVSVNLNHALFSLLSTHDDLAMQAFFLLHRVWFRAIRFGMVWFGASYANLRGPQIFKLRIYEKTLFCIQVNMVFTVVDSSCATIEQLAREKL